VQYVGAVADYLHNLAVYSSVDFRGFDEERFWREFETLRSRFPEFAPAVGYYRELFEQRTNLAPEGSHDGAPCTTPDRAVILSPEWRTSTAVALAQQMRESGDFGAMPILADALQEAGCDNADILAHCRGPGPHVRGCWVVDLVLGKE
jgi:hypothetical protein